MALGTVLSVAQSLLAALQCWELKEMCSHFRYKSQLEQLSETVSTIRAVLLDAESKRDELSHESQEWIQKLKYVVYDADDLLDEFLTLAHLMEGGKVSREVHLFFSRFNLLVVAYKSHAVENTRKELDGIASNHTHFGLNIDSQPIRRRREETCSYVYANDIIGREADTEKIVGILLDSDVQRDVSFLTIVGVGGLGKTTLAQLVYNHGEVQTEFGLRLWACVSDHGQKKLDVKSIVCKVLELTTCRKHDDEFSMDRLQSQLREQLRGKKYLLVLDDVWNGNRDDWVRLVDLFMGGQRGSWIVVTTRSEETARVIGNGPTYLLKGLSEEDSWRLFERTAFEEVEERPKPSDLVEIGYEIVKRCANNPLAIRVVGSLLYGQDKSKWLLCQKIGLTNIRHGENDIMSILKFSYDQLESPLKSCFSYCAVFPKDFVIEKEILISLWMAQGYVVPLTEDQSIEDACEEYFWILLGRCFFQVFRKGEYGDIKSCILHDLMHDIAEEVAGEEIYAAKLITSNLDNKIRHLSLPKNMYAGSYFNETRIRSSLQVGRNFTMKRKTPGMCQFPLEKFLQNCTCLRALDLRSSGIKSLPGSIGKLVHLRYLDISWNDDLNKIPKSVTRLHNLQTLKLEGCSRLKELPKDLIKMVKLEVLDITDCHGLTYMPSGMSNLSCLHKLTMFVVGLAEASSSSKQIVVDQLADLKALMRLKGNLTIRIRIPNTATYMKEEGREGGYMRSKQQLRSVELVWEHEESTDKEVENEEVLLEDMHPHPNLKALALVGYRGVRIPSWAEDDNLTTFLPHLVKIRIAKCHGLQCLPSLGNLPNLKSLVVEDLRNLEYMENSSSSYTVASSSFPSLETLCLSDLPKLKGWWRGVGDYPLVGSSSMQPRQWPLFPGLPTCWIDGCPELTCIPLGPSLEILPSRYVNESKINISASQEGKGKGKEKEEATSSSSDLPGIRRHSKLTRVETHDVGCLKSLPLVAFRSVTEIRIVGDHEVESLSEVGEVFQVCSSSLRSLYIIKCDKLRSLSGREGGGLEQLTALKSLVTADCPNLDMSEEEEEDDDDGILAHSSLRYLSLSQLPKLVKLPKGMQYLTSLQSLHISNCNNLKELPEWIDSLSSLQSLEIWDCKGVESLPQSMSKLTALTLLHLLDCSETLQERCRNPTGEDWPNIQHIPHIRFKLKP